MIDKGATAGDRGQQAIELLRAIVDAGPYREEFRRYCIYCGKRISPYSVNKAPHYDGCLYVKARDLVNA